MEITAQQYINSEKNGNSFITIHTSLYSSRTEKTEKDGDLYILLKMSSERKVPFARLSKFIIDSIVDGYIYSHAKTTNESMKFALNDGIDKLRSLIKNDKDLEDSPIDTTVLTVLVKKEGLYIGRIGEGDIYVAKTGKIINIGDIMKNKSANTAGVVLEEDESLLLSTLGVFSNDIGSIAVASKENMMQREVTRIGVSLPSDSAILGFSNSNKKPQIETTSLSPESKIVNTFIPPTEKKSLRLNVEGVKGKISAGISNIKSFFSKIGEKLRLPSKLKEVLSKIWSGIKVVFFKIFSIISQTAKKVWLKVSSMLSTKRWFKRIMSKFSEINISRKRRIPSTTGVRIDDYKIRDLRGKRFKLVFTVLAIIILLFLGINFTLKSRKASEVSKDVNEKITKIESALNKTETNISMDKMIAESSYFEAGNILKEIPENLREKDRQKVDTVRKRYKDLGDQLFKKVGISESVSNLSKFLDTKLNFGEGSDPTDIEIYRDKANKEYLAITDKGKKAVFTLAIADKSSIKAISDNEKLVKTPLFVSAGISGLFIYDKDGGVLKSPLAEDGSAGNFISLPGLLARDIKASDIVDLSIMTDNDNVYLLSRDQKAILKSSAVYGDRYSMLSKYIGNEAFARGTDLMGDFSVYVLEDTEVGIIRYSWSYVEQKQAETPLGITGLSGDLGRITHGYTYGDTMDSGMYMFDENGRRFLKFEKPQEGGANLRHPNQLLLLKQYEYRGEDENDLKNVKDFVVDLKEENMYVLDGTSVWKVAL